MSVKQKYVRLEQYNQIIIFPITIQHKEFKHLELISAGFCRIYNNEVACFGESTSLRLESLPEDSKIATKQFFEE